MRSGVIFYGSFCAFLHQIFFKDCKNLGKKLQMYFKMIILKVNGIKVPTKINWFRVCGF